MCINYNPTSWCTAYSVATNTNPKRHESEPIIQRFLPKVDFLSVHIAPFDHGHDISDLGHYFSTTSLSMFSSIIINPDMSTKIYIHAYVQILCTISIARNTKGALAGGNFKPTYVAWGLVAAGGVLRRLSRLPPPANNIHLRILKIIRSCSTTSRHEQDYPLDHNHLQRMNVIYME